MPASIVKSFAQKTGKSTKEVERLWSKAKEAAKENGKSEDSEDFYPYVTGILKKMLKVNEMNESTLIARLEKFAGQKIKPGRNTIKGFPVDIEDNPDGDYIEMSAVDLDASKSLTKLLRKAGFKAKATKTEILISEGTTKSTKIFKEFALGTLSESVEVDTDTFVGVHGKKPKGHGSWIFFADKYKTDIRKDDYYQTPHAMSYGDAVKLAKKWAAEKKLFRIYVAS